MPEHVTFVTRNEGKIATLRRGLCAEGIVVNHCQATLQEIQDDSTAVIATRKAEDGFRLVGSSTIALDAGFWLEGLAGFPGPYIEYVLRKIGVLGILEVTQAKERSCHFVESLAYLGADGRTAVFSETIPGRISAEPRGEILPQHWSALATIFIPDGFDKTLAEMSHAEISEWEVARRGNSHMRKFARWL